MKIRLLLIMFFALSAIHLSVHSAVTNQLKGHASPYLAMHGDDPVAWQTWDKEVISRAKKENKLLFVSIGYFACHWCHVMQRESYKDKLIASKLNDKFIPVKVDRELNPALDAYLIEFVQRTRGHAGWPLNVFVTPDGDPVVGVVYLPKDRFRKLLTQVDEMWAGNKDYVRSMAAQAAALQKGEKLTSIKLDPKLGSQFQTKFLQQAMGIADDMLGGFGEQNKFPMTDQMRYLVSIYHANPIQQVGEFLQITLDQMATQGLRDHIGGGFYRYAVDPAWQTPHYEKMLYDNAALATLYMEAADALDRLDYQVVARETLDFMIRELTAKDGGMMASLSAVDAAGNEGAYYLWDKETLIGLLTKKEYGVIFELWKMEDAPNRSLGYLPRHVVSPDEVAKELGLQTAEVMQTIAQAQFKLFKVREKRSLPIDTKQLASWNGLALSALVKGAQLNKGEKYKLAAEKIRRYLVQRLWNGHHLSRAVSRQGSVGQAGLEDYAYAAQGLFDWARLTGNSKDMSLARRWLDIAWQRFYTITGWVLTDEMLIQSELGEAIIQDSPMPSPSSTMLTVSWKIARLTHDDVLMNRTAKALGLGHDKLEQSPFYYANQIALLSRFLEGTTAE